MKKTLKMLSVFISLLMFLNLLVACATSGSGKANTNPASKQEDAESQATAEGKKIDNFNPTGFPIVNQKITLKLMGSNNPRNPNFADSSFFKEMERLTNITFEYNFVNMQAWTEKYNLAFASNDLPDIFFKGSISSSDLEKYGSQGMLIPVEGLIDQYAPNLNAVLNQKPKVKRALTLGDGHIRSFPYLSEIKKDMTGGILNINKKWLDKLELKIPETPEEFYQVLRAFKEKDPNANKLADEIPYTAESMSAMKRFFCMFGIAMDGAVDSNMSANDKGQVVYHPMTDSYKELMKYMNRLFAEKLLDNESFTQNRQQVVAKGTGPEELLGSFIVGGSYVLVGDQRHFDYVAVPPFKIDGVKRVWPGFPEGKLSIGVCSITNRNKYPEATVRWLDYLYTEDGGKLMMGGVENQDYKYNANGKWNYINPKNLEKLPLADSISPFPGFPLPFLMPMKFINDQEEKVPVIAWQEQEHLKILPYLIESYPMITFSTDVQKQVSTLTADINPYVDEMLARFITGDVKIDSEWENYISTLKKMGIEELVKIYQKAYDDYMKK